MTDPDRWHAVLTRDASQAGRFVYAVTTTGVFCRPGCPSRRPRHDNVRFFDDAAAARAAGFRPCRRCRPDAAATAAGGGGDPWPDRLARACAHIDACLDGPEATAPTLAALADHVGVSPYHLHRRFKAGLGVSPKAYAEARRQARLRGLLRAGEPVATAVYEAGYGAPSRVYEQSAAALGTTPARFRAGSADLAIRCLTADGPLGRILIAATDRGVCFVGLGTDDAMLRAELAAEYPKADIRTGDAPLLHQALAAVLARLAGDMPADTLPLDVRATAFRRRVWEELRRIPAGTVRSYGEIARAVGRPGAARAVGSACAGNPVAVLVPCHRVVRGDGDRGGYRWGVDRKQALLDAEAGATRHGSGTAATTPGTAAPGTAAPGTAESAPPDRCGTRPGADGRMPP